MHKLLFLPGAGGSPSFWQPVTQRLPADWDKVHLGWPGLGDQPHDPSIKSFDDMIAMVKRRIDRPIDLVAQSMGGTIAVRITLARPQMVRRLALVVTSAGIDMRRFGAADWRPEYRKTFPKAADWIFWPSAAAELPVDRIVAPTLLIWGDADPISPVAVGRHLASLIPRSALHVVPGGDHDLARKHPERVATLLADHFR